MTQTIHLPDHAVGGMLGMRSTAGPLRLQLDRMLFVERQGDVVLDFTGVSVTQGFVDELIGQIVLRDGPDVMRRIVSKGCSEEAKGIIRFVVADRACQFDPAN